MKRNARDILEILVNNVKENTDINIEKNKKLDVFCKKFLRNFAKLTGKHLSLTS